jgi:hypothetical protein
VNSPCRMRPIQPAPQPGTLGGSWVSKGAGGTRRTGAPPVQTRTASPISASCAWAQFVGQPSGGRDARRRFGARHHGSAGHPSFPASDSSRDTPFMTCGEIDRMTVLYRQFPVRCVVGTDGISVPAVPDAVPRCRAWQEIRPARSSNLTCPICRCSGGRWSPPAR